MTFVTFGLIVTGQGERSFLPELFDAMCSGALCTFKVIRKSGQLRPITSPKRQLRMVGAGKLPSIDETQYGLPAHRFLRDHPNGHVLVIDDLETHPVPDDVFARYRTALDAVLARQNLSNRAGVFFLVNMLEAYYFAHAAAVNEVAGRQVLDADYDGDVEDMPHPKGDLKAVWPEFREIQHGQQIVSRLRVEYVLRNPDRCCWLRSIFAWCLDHLSRQDAVWDDALAERFQLPRGQCVPLVLNQGA